MLRRLAIALTGLLLLAAPAAAAEPSDCAFTHGGSVELNRFIELVQPVAEEAEAWLGEQSAGTWVQPRDRNWYVGVAPGPVSTEQARARVLELVDARYDGEDEAQLRERLRMSEQPYGEPELRRVQDELSGRIVQRPWGRSVSWSLGIGCEASRELRVEFTLYRDATPEMAADAAEQAASFGDRVRVRHLQDQEGPTATAGPAPPAALRFGDVARAVRAGRCALRVTLRSGWRGRVAAVAIAAGGRRVTLAGSRLRRVLRLPVRRGTSVATVQVRLLDGRRASRSIRLRCAR